MSVRLGVIGAGSAAAAASYALRDASPALEVTVFEKSRGVCGRAAARRRTRHGRRYVYEYGANYLSDDDPRVNALLTGPLADGRVEVQGPIWTFDAAGTVTEGRDADKRRWTYADGITRLAKHLFARAGATVVRDTRIATVQRRTDASAGPRWHMTDAEGKKHGPFDRLLVTPPAPQAAALLQDTGVPSVDRLGAAADAVDYRTVWTAVLGYDHAIERPYYALVNTDKAHPVGWIGREEKKPGHVPAGASVLVVQASPDWSTRRYERPPAENVAALAGHAADLLDDDRLADPDWTDWQGWRYALPEAGVDAERRPAAAQHGVHVAGDWVAGAGRLHAAVRSGLDTGERLATMLPTGGADA